MVCETAGLIILLVVLVIYVRLRNRNNQPDDNGIELRQIRKQLQQVNNLFATFVVQLLAEYKQTEAELDVATSEKESLKQTVQELQQQLASVESERDEGRETLTKLHLENTLLEQKVEQLESHKKVLIQELGGSLSGQDIELITWEFLIQKIKEVTKQFNEVIVHNQSLIQTHRDLQRERDVLRRELNQLKDNNARLTQDNLQLRANKNPLESELRRTLDRIKPLEKTKEKLEQEKAQLERNFYELNKVESRLRQAEAENKQLKREVEELKQTKKNLEVDLLKLYNDLVYFVQESLNCSGIEELDDWEKTEEFYIEFISRLCFIDTILVTKIQSLEDQFHLIPKENNNYDLAVTFSYPGKFLFWSNSTVRWELSSFFNSKL